MLESIITISITGLIAGFIFAMPIAGPISILITSNALKGKLRYSNHISLGAAFGDFFYIFFAVYGVTKLYAFYKPAIPYLFVVGAVFFIYLGIKIFRTKFNIEHFDEDSHLTDKIKKKVNNGFYTGFMVNLLNPTLFLSGLTSSFFVISLVASLGFNTGGLDLKVNENAKEISEVEGITIEKPELPIESLNNLKTKDNEGIVKKPVFPSYFHFMISLVYAIFISAGNIIWFRLFAYFLVRYRSRINVKVLRVLIGSFGTVLCILGLYLGYMGLMQLT